LSGHTDLGDAMKAVKVAHQFLAKPCDAETMRSVLLRAAGLHALLCDRALQTLAASMRDIPSRPETYTALSERLADPNATSGQIAKLIARDVGMAASLLKIVNSAFFGSPRRVTSIESAINYLGTSMLSSVILANAATSALGPRAREHGYDLELSGTHALLSANLAMRMFTEKAAREDAFAAGLLQNIGELLLVAIGPDTALVAMAHAKAHGTSLEVAERELGVVSHAHVGAYLLGAWGLPYGIVEAVAHHHEPQAIKHAALELVDAVHVGALVADHYLLQREDSLLRARQHLAAIGAEARFAPLEAAAERLMSKEPP
jgi:HD-like signal output (HDOD) protein